MLKEEMSATLSLIIKCLKVNRSKTEICIFHKNSCIKIFVNFDGLLVGYSDSITVLGVDTSLAQLKNHSNPYRRKKITSKFFTRA
jgi:hypothetical protein